MESKLIYHMGQIKAHFALNRKRVFYSTHVKVSAESIDGKGFIKSKSHPNWQNLNQQILLHKQKLDNAILKDLQVHGSVDVDRVKLLLFQRKSETQGQTEHTSKSEELLSKVLTEFLGNQPNIGKGLLRRYDALAQSVKENDCICKNIKAPYLHDLLDKFRNNVNANTGYSRYKNFKRFVLWCQENGYDLPKIEWRRLTKPTFKPDFVFLTDDRISQVISWKAETQFEDKIKNIFLVLIYTGMRYSDYSSLNSSEIHNGCIDKIARKTKIRFKVPIHSSIEHIVKAPPKMSCQTFNKGLQALGKRLGWIETIRFRTDINQFVMIPFYEMLCSSVGRHTFATRALLSGIPHNIIMGWCGWANSSMLFYYSEKLKIQTSDWMNKIK